MSKFGRHARVTGILVSGFVLAGCQQMNMGGLDFDLRNNAADGLDTSSAARVAVSERPEADANGLITYPNYQVAVAQRGDTVTSVAQRIGFPAAELASFNGLSSESRLNQNAILALPRRIEPAAGAARPDITTIAGAAIDRAGATPAAAGIQGGREPIRHRVARGETAFSIARLYGVSPRSMAEWNGLGPDLAVREGQFLLIPPVAEGVAGVDEAAPGQGSVTPVPPSASSALPQTVEAEPLPESPNLDSQRTEVTAQAAPATAETPAPQVDDGQTLQRPVTGSVLRGFSGRNEGIDFSAAEGTAVSAAASGTVAAITRDTDQVPILVLRHAGGLLTVYANIKDIRVEKGDEVSAGQTIAAVGPGNPPFLHFEVRQGFDAVDPAPLLN